MREETLHDVEAEETKEQADKTNEADVSKEDSKNNWEQSLKEREEALLKREQKLEIRLMEKYAKEELNKVHIPENLSKFIVAETREKTLSNIEEFKEDFYAAVQEAVLNRIGRKTPKADISVSMRSEKDSITKQIQKTINGGMFK